MLNFAGRTIPNSDHEGCRLYRLLQQCEYARREAAVRYLAEGAGYLLTVHPPTEFCRQKVVVLHHKTTDDKGRTIRGEQAYVCHTFKAAVETLGYYIRRDLLDHLETQNTPEGAA